MGVDDISDEMRCAQVEFHRLIASATPDELGRQTNGTRWTNRQLLFHMVLGYGVTRTLLPLVRTLGRLGHSRGFAVTLNAVRRPFDWINYIGPCVAGRLLTLHLMTALMDRVIRSLQGQLADETESRLVLRMHMPTDWDPYFTPTMSVLDVYHFGIQHFEHHRQQLTLTSPQV